MRTGFSIIELLIVLTLLAIGTSLGMSRVSRTLDAIAVRGATADVANTFAFSRQLAISGMRYSTLKVDSANASVVVLLGADTIVSRLVGQIHGVRISSNRDSMAYNPIGHGFGAANQTIVIRRGSITDSVVLSRLGRVRH